MKDWQAHWQTFPARFETTHFLEQVGKTVDRRPIPGEQLALITSTIRERLALDPEDRVLDLCCGNGLLTNALADDCGQMTGVDYSRPLIEVAREHNQPDEVDYVLGDARRLDDALADTRFDKAYMYEAAQHFSREDLAATLSGLAAHLESGARVYVASVPDRARVWAFHDTLRRRFDYVWRAVRNDQALGTWWRRRDLVAMAAEYGFEGEALDQDPRLYTAHYRFDLVLHRR